MMPRIPVKKGKGIRGEGKRRVGACVVAVAGWTAQLMGIHRLRAFAPFTALRCFAVSVFRAIAE